MIRHSRSPAGAAGLASGAGCHLDRPGAAASGRAAGRPGRAGGDHPRRPGRDPREETAGLEAGDAVCGIEPEAGAAGALTHRHVEGIEGGARALEALAREHGWGLLHTENGAVFNPNDLARFDVVVFLNASGDMLSADQERAFQTWFEAGGGWLGIHGAGDDSHADWQWYRDNLIGADFTAHIMGPQFQTATVVLENPAHPALRGLPKTWEHEEEWYSWARSPREEGFLVLATLDENSYSPVQKMFGWERDLRMGDHPVVWANCVLGGRSLYLTMGHGAEAFEQPQVGQLMENALLWLTGPPGTGCP